MAVIDEYLGNVGEPQKTALERVRQTVKRAAPEAEEVISYGMPAFKYRKKYLIGFAPFKDHMSIFPGAYPEEFKNKLGGFKTSKGTIQFTVDHQLPEEIIEELVKVRVAEIEK